MWQKALQGVVGYKVVSLVGITERTRGGFRSFWRYSGSGVMGIL